MDMLVADINARGLQGDGSPIPPLTARLTPELKKQAEAAVR